MIDPNLLYYFGKLRQKELIELGQQSKSASPRDAEARRPRWPATLLLVLFRAFSR